MSQGKTLARRKARVGVAGWDYPDWKGVLYPDPKPRGFDPLRFLADYVDLIEVNSSFYGPPRATSAKQWLERIADVHDFTFTAKLWRRFTHERKAAWTRKDVKDVTSGFDVLAAGDRLGAVVMQFPWSFRNDKTSREWLSDLVDTFAQYPLVVEVRHESWNDADFYAWLAERGVGIVNIDQPLFRKSIRPGARATSHVGYVRVHGRNYKDWFRKNAGRDARYDYLYPVAELKPWVQRVEAVAAAPETESVDVVFNNHYKAQAVVNVVQFKGLITGRKAPAPPALVEAYPAELGAGKARKTAA